MALDVNALLSVASSPLLVDGPYGSGATISAGGLLQLGGIWRSEWDPTPTAQTGSAAEIAGSRTGSVPQAAGKRTGVIT